MLTPRMVTEMSFSHELGFFCVQHKAGKSYIELFVYLFCLNEITLYDCQLSGMLIYDNVK